MKKLTIVYLVISAVLSVLTAIILQMHLKEDYNLLLIPFLAFLFVYGVIVLFFVSKKKKEIESLNQTAKENTDKTNEWKLLVKDAHYSEVETLQSDIENLKNEQAQQLEKIQSEQAQQLEKIQSEHEKRIDSIVKEHEQKIEYLNEEKARELEKVVQELMPYKDIVEKSGAFLGTNADGIRDRIKEMEILLSNVVNSMDGVQYERYVGYVLKTEGWKDITYTPATGDYGADILGIDSDGQRACVQCKCYSEGTPVGGPAISAIIGAKSYYGCEKAYVCTTHRITQQAENYATKTGVIIKIIK